MNSTDSDVTRSEGFSLKALRNGDRAEFSRVVEAYYAHIYRLAMKILGNQQDAEDVLQDTFLKAFKHLDSFDGRAKLSTWLYRIATNEALMILRRQRSNVSSIDEPLDTDEGEQEPLNLIDWCCVPEKELMSQEVQKYLDLAVEELPDNLRVVFVLRDIENLSTQETAEVLGLSETAVKTRLSRARMRLRQDLSVYFYDRVVKGDLVGDMEN